jgi:hypothetical protein
MRFALDEHYAEHLEYEDGHTIRISEEHLKRVYRKWIATDKSPAVFQLKPSPALAGSVPPEVAARFMQIIEEGADSWPAAFWKFRGEWEDAHGAARFPYILNQFYKALTQEQTARAKQLFKQNRCRAEMSRRSERDGINAKSPLNPPETPEKSLIGNNPQANEKKEKQ